MTEPLVTMCLCGDVMTGRGVDQILPHPGDPRLWEPAVADARGYVALAERVNGRIPMPVDFDWPWGDALGVLADVSPELRLINLETSITRGGRPDPDKRLHYRMSPENLPCLTAARPDVCTLANNHVLDFGRSGLADTLDALASAGVLTAGAGRTATEAEQPAVITNGGGRTLVFALASPTSGVPPEWAASPHRPGVALLPDLSEAAAEGLIARVRRVKRPGDLVVVSLHWGSNWGYDVPADFRRFARALVDGGVDVVYGHSSHHPRPIEVYRGKLVLYGCGDLVNDYEGISGYQEYRDELRLLYLATLRRGTGVLVGLRMVPLRSQRMRLRRAGRQDAEWLRAGVDRISRPFGVRVGLAGDAMLELRRSG